MPILTAYPDVPRAYVRVEASWADTPVVTQASVVRVDVVTETCTPLRPYVCFDGDELELSCGLGIWWDTEVPLDRQVYYITQSTQAPCIPVGVDPCVPCEIVTAESGMVTIPSNGAFRLRDPVRPCHDLYVPLCFDQVPDPTCLPGSGVFFASMDTESYGTNAILLNPTNASNPLLVSRQRRNVTSVLTLVTRTFADRDDLLTLLNPGSPVLLQGPPQYGINDRYMAVDDVSVERGLSDHKFPIRVNTLPYTAVGRPAGPTQGVCGSQVGDTCDIYSTWQELADAGLTWADLIRGYASQDSGAAFANRRTWDDVNAEFVDWDDVNTGGRTCVDLEVGN
jgi:hypothetical protein